MNLARHWGLDLPVFPSDSEVLNRWQVREIAEHPDNQVIRYVNIFAGGCRQLTLKKALRTADKEFRRVAEMGGAAVIPHTWGLYPRGPSFNPHSTQVEVDLLPQGHLLVAEVDVVRNPIEVDDSTADGLLEALRGYAQNRKGLSWSDANLKQFVHGATSVQPVPTLWLVDIEPRLYKY